MGIKAYMLVNVEVGMTEEVISELGGLKGVKAIDRVAGPYDLVINIEVPELSDLTAIIKQIPHEIGIQKTTTLIVLR
jgi:DNA-binding Lrp family transcriptional regulator